MSYLEHEIHVLLSHFRARQHRFDSQPSHPPVGCHATPSSEPHTPAESFRGANSTRRRNLFAKPSHTLAESFRKQTPDPNGIFVAAGSRTKLGSREMMAVCEKDSAGVRGSSREDSVGVRGYAVVTARRDSVVVRSRTHAIWKPFWGCFCCVSESDLGPPGGGPEVSSGTRR